MNEKNMTVEERIAQMLKEQANRLQYLEKGGSGRLQVIEKNREKFKQKRKKLDKKLRGKGKIISSKRKASTLIESINLFPDDPLTIYKSVNGRSGIYKIFNKASGRSYIGKSKNIEARWRTHIKLLQSGTHHCKDLQEEWIVYGYDRFFFEIIKICSEKKLTNLELKYWSMEKDPFNRDPRKPWA